MSETIQPMESTGETTVAPVIQSFKGLSRQCFKDAPDLWTRASRTYQTPAEWANPFHGPARKERFAGVLVAVTIGVALASVVFLGLSGAFR